MIVTSGQSQLQQYNSVAKFLHWLIALAILFMLVLGFVMVGLPTDYKFKAFQLHKSVGITILLLSLFRLSWRLFNPPPRLPETMAKWEQAAANITHFLFYVFMIGMPLLGWVMVSASNMGMPTLLYGLVPWPHLPFIPEMANKQQIGHTAADLHNLSAFILSGLIVLHIGAAWKHHLFNRDNVLLRMAPKPLHGVLNKIRGA